MQYTSVRISPDQVAAGATQCDKSDLSGGTLSSCEYALHVRFTISDPFSATITTGAMGLQLGPVGNTDASMTRKLGTPSTRSSGSTTVSRSHAGPILHVPVWWFSGLVSVTTTHAQYASLSYGWPAHSGYGVGSGRMSHLARARVPINARTVRMLSTIANTSRGSWK